MELRDYLRIVRRRWKIILGCVVLLAAVASGITLTATPQYASSARLFVTTPSSDSTEANQGAQFSEQRVASYVDLATGRELATRVIRRLGLHTTASELTSQITAEAKPGTVIITLTATDGDPVKAQRLAQAYARELSNLVASLETTSSKDEAPVRATVVDSAAVPTSPVSPTPRRNLALGIVAGLALGFGLAAVREVLDTSLKSQEDVAETSGTSVMATLTFEPSAARRPLLSELGAHPSWAEAFRVLRTNLQFVKFDADSKVFVVSSAVSGEGKTMTAGSLAATLSQAGERVLLIEGDLRKPTLADQLGLDPAVGLTTLLLGQTTLEEALQHPSACPELTVMPSGMLPPNPSELLQSQAMSDLVTKLRLEFDVILIDAPPMLPVTDAALLATQSDGALLVVRHSRTTHSQLTRAIERLKAVGAEPLGVVLNMVPRRHVDIRGYGYTRTQADYRRGTQSRGRGRGSHRAAWSATGTPRAHPVDVESRPHARFGAGVRFFPSWRHPRPEQVRRETHSKSASEVQSPDNQPPGGAQHSSSRFEEC